jgi:uncharacterized membrane-anchored protein YitT (DUF2179 family)
MKTHMTGTGVSDRRAKGKNSKPTIYLMIEIFILAISVFFISFAEIRWLTVLSAVTAIFFFLMSCLPRYKRVRSRQVAKHIHNNIHN